MSVHAWAATWKRGIAYCCRVYCWVIKQWNIGEILTNICLWLAFKNKFTAKFCLSTVIFICLLVIEDKSAKRNHGHVLNFSCISCLYWMHVLFILAIPCIDGNKWANSANWRYMYGRFRHQLPVVHQLHKNLAYIRIFTCLPAFFPASLLYESYFLTAIAVFLCCWWRGRLFILFIKQKS